MTVLSFFAAAEGDPVTLALIAIVGTVITALFKLLHDNTKAQEKVGSSIEKLTSETAKGNREAKQRNGHLGEQNVKITEMIADVRKEMGEKADRNLRAMQQVKVQHVVSQRVDKSTVKDERVEHQDVE